jgi:hypothetical protein
MDSGRLANRTPRLHLRGIQISRMRVSTAILSFSGLSPYVFLISRTPSRWLGVSSKTTAGHRIRFRSAALRSPPVKRPACGRDQIVAARLKSAAVVRTRAFRTSVYEDAPCACEDVVEAFFDLCRRRAMARADARGARLGTSCLASA